MDSTLPRLYRDLAHLWPVLSPPSDYGAEADAVRGVLDELVPTRRGERRSVLELGAGGGHTLFHLGEAFDCVAADVSPEMLRLCRVLNPGIDTVVGDMRTMRLDQRLEAVLIHDAIDYMTTPADVEATLATAAAHLRQGGVMLVAPTYTTQTFHDGEVASDQHRADGICVTSISHVARIDSGGFELVMLLLLHTPGQAAEVVVDRHRCGLFTDEAWRAMVEAAGFDLRDGMIGDDVPWEAYVGIKRG